MRTAAERVAVRYIRAKSTQNVDKIELLVEALRDPIGVASRWVFISYSRPTSIDLDRVSRSISSAAGALLDAMTSMESENRAMSAFLKRFEAKLRNLRKMLKSYVGKDTWVEMEPVIRSQGTQTKMPIDKIREYTGLLLGMLKATDIEPEGTLRHAGFNIVLMNTARGDDWSEDRLTALKHVLDASVRSLSRIGLGGVVYGTVMAFPTKQLPPGAGSGHNAFASYRMASDDIRVSIDSSDMNQTITAMVHELGHRAYFKLLSGRGRSSWRAFFDVMQGAPDVDGIIAAWEKYAAGTEPDEDGRPDYWATKYGMWSPYFADHLRKTGQRDMLMWLKIVMNKIGIKEAIDPMTGSPKRTKGNTPGLEQLKAKKGEVRAFLYPVTAYSATDADELFAEIVSMLAISGPGRIPEILLAEFQKAIPQVKVAAVTYVAEPPTPAQARCGHRIRNRDNSECSVCGSRKRGNRWEYLSERDFHYYTSGK